MSAGPPGGGAAGAADAAPARGARAGVVVANRVRRGFYLDSVALMRVSASLSEGEGVEAVSLMIGSPSNLALLDEAGLLTEAGRAAGPDDLVLAVRAESGEALDAALDAAEEKLESAAAEEGPERWGGAAARLPTLRAAREALPGANLAIVSVPGPFAAREARRALAAGLHVLVFSDNVPVEEEVTLKREARARGLALMGPDCGTAIVAGTPLAFANRVRRGSIGTIAASGTGLQELSVLVHRGGGGISHGIGVGGRDLDDRVGGLGAFMALDALEADPDTRHVVIVSKPPGPRTEAALLARLAECPKPVTLCLVGRDGGEPPPNAAFAPTLRDAARLALGSGDGGGGEPDGAGPGGSGGPAREPGAAAVPAPLPSAPPPPLPPARPGRIVGLFSGGTLCAEGQAILRRAGLPVASNAPIPGAAHLAPSGPASVLAPPQPPAPASADGHAFLDLGADEYTAGRPHPMIEPAMRSEALADTLADPTVAVVALDVILGTGSHPDPAASVVEVLGASAPGDRPVVVASVCGTELDPQDYGAQRRALERAGVFVAGSNADAVEAAIRIAAPGPGPGTAREPERDREDGSR